MSEQLVLLDAGPQARRSDPPTSKAAAASTEMSPTFQAAILSVIAERQPVISEDIAVEVRERLATYVAGRPPCHSTVVARVTTLRKLGLIVPDGTGVTSSGRSAVAYKLAGEGK